MATGRHHSGHGRNPLVLRGITCVRGPYDSARYRAGEQRPITYCYVAELAVRAGHRNRGVGRRLMAAAGDWGRRHGASVASLDYHVSNGTAAEFYRRVMGDRAAHIVAIKGLQPR